MPREACKFLVLASQKLFTRYRTWKVTIELSAHLDLIHDKYAATGHPDGSFFDFSTARLEGTTDYHILYVASISGLED